MSTKIKNTLFRFTSLRAPELVEEHKNKDGFVTRDPGVTAGAFDTAISGLTEEESKWQALQDAAVDFGETTAKMALSEIKDLKPDLYELSVWLAKNRSSFDIADFESRLSTVTAITDNGVLGSLWDNLFYQVVTQKDFYIKEAIIQLLTANHVVANYNLEGYDKAKALATAKVVLPGMLFSEDVDYIKGYEATVTVSNAVPSSTMARQQKVARAQLLNEELNTLSKALKRVEKIYRKEYKSALEEAMVLHKNEIDPILAQYEKDVEAANKAWCDIAKDSGVTYDPNDPCKQPPSVPKPALPKLDFHFAKELDFNYLNSKMDNAIHNQLVELVALRAGNIPNTITEEDYDEFTEDLEGFEDLQNYISGEIDHNNDIISENSSNDETVHVSLGGILVPLDNGSTQSNFSFQLCSKLVRQSITNPSIGKFNADIEITLPEPSWELASFDYIVSRTDGDYSNNQLETYSVSQSGNLLQISNIHIGGIVTEESPSAFNFDATLTFTNGVVKVIKLSELAFGTCSGGKLLEGDGQESSDATSSPFVPSGFGFKQLGIADYNKVEQTTQGYVEGDVAHIENIMAREFKERSTRRLRRKEDTLTTSSETEREQLTDTTSTSRFEMHSEVANVIQEGRDVAASTSFMGSYGQGDYDVQLGANASFASFNSKEESTQQAITEAQDITERALDRIVSKVKEERIEKIVEEFEENNTHGFDNRKGDKHVVGVFRWVDKIFKNQIINYGKRLMFEFMVPQPGKLHRLALKGIDTGNTIVPPVDPRTATVHKLETYDDLDDTKLKHWTSKYNVAFEPKPYPFIYVGKSFSQNQNTKEQGFTFSETDTIKIPENYESTHMKLQLNGGSTFGPANGLGSGSHTISGDVHSVKGVEVGLSESVPNFRGEFPVSYFATAFHGSSGSIRLKCELTTEAQKQWKQETFKAIIDAYEEALEAYNQKVAEHEATGVQIKGSNPGFYREFENKILRKNCISYLIDQNPDAKNTYGKSNLFTTNNGGPQGFGNTEVRVNEDLDRYTAFVKFMEQAFEWEIMSYNLYPYYWGNRSDWTSLYQYSDTIDPLFRNFMQAGMARVVVTVRPGFEEAVRFYMQTGQIWNGGEVPVIEDELYLSIVDELREPKGEKRGKAWPTRVPTALTILQAQSIGLNVAKALPFNDEALDDFEDPSAVPQSQEIDVDPTLMGDSLNSGTARLLGDITGNDGIEAKVVLKRIDGAIQDLTYTDTSGYWELNNLPAGRFELLLDADGDFETYQVTAGSKEQVVELDDDQILEVDLTVASA